MTDYYDENGNEDLNAAFDADPAGTAAAMAAAAATQAAQFTAQQMQMNNNDLIASQVNLAATQVDREMSETYADWDALKPHVIGVLQQTPHLIPGDAGALDTNILKQSLTAAYKLAKGDKADEYARNRWQEIQGANLGKLDL